MTWDKVFGNICCIIIRDLEAPSALAAFTNSRFLNKKVLPLISLAIDAQFNKTIIPANNINMTLSSALRGKRATNAKYNGYPGNDNANSVIL